MKRDLHIGKVLDNDDLDKIGGVKIQINEIVDGAALYEDDYIPGRFPFAGNGEGFFYPPQINAMLEVEIEGDPEAAVEELVPRWVGMLYTSEDEIPAEFKKDHTNRGGITFGDEVFLQDKKKALTSIISEKVRLGEEEASHPLNRGDTYNAELDTFLIAFDTYLTAENTFVGELAALHNAEKANATIWKALPPAAPVLGSVLAASGTLLETVAGAAGTGAATYQTAIATFQSAIATFRAAEDSWLSTKCKTE